MWLPASAIFASIVTILVSFEAILMRFFVRINFTSQFQSNDLPQALKYIKTASKLKGLVSILASIVTIIISFDTILIYFKGYCRP